MKFKYLTEEKLKNLLNEALNNALEFEQIKINPEIEYSISLELDYHELLEKFEEHIKDIILTNKNL